MNLFFKHNHVSRSTLHLSTGLIFVNSLLNPETAYVTDISNSHYQCSSIGYRFATALNFKTFSLLHTLPWSVACLR